MERERKKETTRIIERRVHKERKIVGVRDGVNARESERVGVRETSGRKRKRGSEGLSEKEEGEREQTQWREKERKRASEQKGRGVIMCHRCVHFYHYKNTCTHTSC